MEIGKEGIRCAIVLLVLVAAIGSAQALPDLVVTSVTPNCGYLFANESNEISATVKNNGSADAGAFNVCFVIDGFNATAPVSALSAGNDTAVSITDPTPRTADDSVTITVMADCDGDVSESNETNNVTVQEETVMNNGYNGKRYTGGEDITTREAFDLKGDLL
jgi:subtilase family serine protease